MIGKHVDLIAVGLLLGGVALYSEARNLALIHVVPDKRIEISQVIQRAMTCSRSARVMRGVRVQGPSAVPDLPPLPRITITSD